MMAIHYVPVRPLCPPEAPLAGSTWLAARRETLGWRLESSGMSDGSDRRGRDAPWPWSPL